MLYLTRKIGESVIINDEIEVTVVDIRGKSIKLGFTFPPDASVLRREIHERIQAENQAAAEATETFAEALTGKPGKGVSASPSDAAHVSTDEDTAEQEAPSDAGSGARARKIAGRTK